MEPDFECIICTFKRPTLVCALLADIAGQTVQPRRISIVDGDQDSFDLLDAISRANPMGGGVVHYIKSTHANLAFQRYVGWRSAARQSAACVVYLDDDLRLLRSDALESVVYPIASGSDEIVGCTAETREEPPDAAWGTPALLDRHSAKDRKQGWIVRHFGASRNLVDGEVSACGHRRPAVPRPGSTLAPVECLQGRVMAYSMRVLRKDCFPPDLFALCEVGCGLGEDTVISRRVRSRGELLMRFGNHFYHPSVAPPNSYPTKAQKLGFASAVSRRVINDNYRWPNRPTIGDRLDLARSYVGNAVLAMAQCIREPRAHRFYFLAGYVRGALRGLFAPITHRRATASIDWEADAERALASVVVVEEIRQKAAAPQ